MKRDAGERAAGTSAPVPGNGRRGPATVGERTGRRAGRSTTRRAARDESNPPSWSPSLVPKRGRDPRAHRPKRTARRNPELGRRGVTAVKTTTRPPATSGPARQAAPRREPPPGVPRRPTAPKKSSRRPKGAPRTRSGQGADRWADFSRPRSATPATAKISPRRPFFVTRGRSPHHRPGRGRPMTWPTLRYPL